MSDEKHVYKFLDDEDNGIFKIITAYKLDEIEQGRLQRLCNLYASIYDEFDRLGVLKITYCIKHNEDCNKQLYP